MNNEEFQMQTCITTRQTSMLLSRVLNDFENYVDSKKSLTLNDNFQCNSFLSVAWRDGFFI